MVVVGLVIQMLVTSTKFLCVSMDCQLGWITLHLHILPSSLHAARGEVVFKICQCIGSECALACNFCMHVGCQ